MAVEKEMKKLGDLQNISISIRSREAMQSYNKPICHLQSKLKLQRMKLCCLIKACFSLELIIKTTFIFDINIYIH